LPLVPGCKVLVLYPEEREGGSRTASAIGTLERASPKSHIAWVAFPMEDGREAVRRIDQGRGMSSCASLGS
jgi:hypothetical protein